MENETLNFTFHIKEIKHFHNSHFTKRILAFHTSREKIWLKHMANHISQDALHHPPLCRGCIFLPHAMRPFHLFHLWHDTKSVPSVIQPL